MHTTFNVYIIYIYYILSDYDHFPKILFNFFCYKYCVFSHIYLNNYAKQKQPQAVKKGQSPIKVKSKVL